MHRRPCSFFRSVEFWTIAVKTLAIAPLMLPAILKAGFSADADNFNRIMRIINGSNNGEADRWAYLTLAKQVFGV